MTTSSSRHTPAKRLSDADLMAAVTRVTRRNRRKDLADYWDLEMWESYVDDDEPDDEPPYTSR